MRTRKERKRIKSLHKERFVKMFSFLFNSYRSGILTFAGSKVITRFNIDSDDAMFVFKSFENGNICTNTKHPNILKAVIIAKKSWGLFCNEWTDGIVDGLFTREEILNEFTTRNIVIPKSLIDEFDNLIHSKKIIRNLKELKRLTRE